jgi:3-carboxy-cis,cis-muconate cycloisomerase
MLAAWDDASLVRHALAFEAALARAQAAEGLITEAQAAAIGEACAQIDIDFATLAEEAAHAGTLAIPLVRRLRAEVVLSDPAAAEQVHRGATSQDVADTAMMLQARAGLELLDGDLTRIASALVALAKAHSSTPMLGRTLLQSAAPITFGLKAANWLASIDAARARLAFERQAALSVQFGGAVGSRAGLGGVGQKVAERLAAELGLGCPALPWHSRRDGVAGLAAALAIVAGAVGKIAGDVALLAQGEVAEASEPAVEGRGGSSAMAHKRNPTGCQIALAAALRAPHLAATILAAMPQEHERGLGGWQAEGAVLADLFAVTHGGVAAMAPVLEGLQVDTAAMARNLARADVGSDVGEAEAMVLHALAERGA